MKVRVFRGASLPSFFMGLPYVIGAVWILSFMLLAVWCLIILSETALMVGAFLLLSAYLSFWVIARQMTKKDPHRLNQVAMALILRLGQWSNFGKRGYLVFVPRPYKNDKLKKRIHKI